MFKGKVYKDRILWNIMKKTEKVIMKVWKNKIKNQKLITIQKDSNIHEGDYVEVIKIK